MFGRFTLRTKAEEIALYFVLAEVPDLKPHYNIAPTQKVTTIRFDPQRGNRQLSLLRWGLIPSWADNPAIGNRLINARSETVAIKPAFRQAFQKGRCLVVADGFFEWKKTGVTKQPYYIRLNDDKPFAFAGFSK
jgi:putative SOS response-associated peptidase YedK